jgi:hypothetical protein
MLSAAIERQSSDTGQAVEVPHTAILALPGFFLAWTPWYRHLKFFKTVLAFIFPLGTVKYIQTGTQWRPDRRFCQIMTVAYRTDCSSDYGKSVLYWYPEGITALSA